jgi:HPt (histidine-containing phosphotransfer) domain-containing protein
MHGQIGVESEEGKGSKFWFTIECEKQTQGVNGPAGATALHGLKALVVDGHGSNRRVVAGLLRRFGCRVSEAADPESASPLLKEAVEGGDPFRIVLLDGRLDHGELGDEFRATIPLWMTRLIDRNARSASRSLTKPIFERKLCEAVTNAVAGSAVQAPTGPSSIFDSQALLDRLMGDEELAQQVIHGFIEDIPQQLRDLGSRLAAGDAPGARLQAHSIKGAAGMLAAGRFRETAGKIEREARFGEISQAAGYTSELEARLEELTLALSRSGWA